MHTSLISERSEVRRYVSAVFIFSFVYIDLHLLGYLFGFSPGGDV